MILGLCSSNNYVKSCFKNHLESQALQKALESQGNTLMAGGLSRGEVPSPLSPPVIPDQVVGVG